MSYGIFLGYRLQPGGTWSGEYIVADLSDYVGRNLHADARYTGFKGIRPHITDTAALGRRRICFPLKQRYDIANMTLEGLESAMDEYGYARKHLPRYDRFWFLDQV